MERGDISVIGRGNYFRPLGHKLYLTACMGSFNLLPLGQVNNIMTGNKLQSIEMFYWSRVCGGPTNCNYLILLCYYYPIPSALQALMSFDLNSSQRRRIFQMNICC
ncbi:hypothetical protein CHS0354_002769 [Potamilus streckersoni]|uniref:Uncharacterized protein n=1 Tax=Potamilus streckersoni TaxID=2493646 RepID=A0AAE0VZX1_9BIVA|nr:hypothetical protein CHS0354_002769 [Potamilus streckersoni]